MKKRIHKKIRRRTQQESTSGEELKTEIIPTVKSLTQKIISVVKELSTAQYAWCRDDTELHTWYT